MTATPGKNYSYKSLSNLRTGLIVCLILSLILSIIKLVSNVCMYLGFNRPSFPVSTSIDKLTTDLWIVGVIELCEQPLLWITAILLLIWIHRAFANLLASGIKGLSYSPGWAVGWWFIPIANFYKPYSAMCELWEESKSGGDSNDSSFFNGTAHIAVWWCCWLGSTFVARWASMIFVSAINPDAKSVTTLNIPQGFMQTQINGAIIASIAATGLKILATILLIMIIRKITSNQTAKLEDLAATSAAQ
jgi:hypothetical protein